jgi:hypothetical protein
MFDSPKIVDCSFKKENGLYKITASTNNNQVWIYTFGGVDSNFKYLVNKIIKVEKKRVS